MKKWDGGRGKGYLEGEGIGRKQLETGFQREREKQRAREGERESEAENTISTSTYLRTTLSIKGKFTSNFCCLICNVVKRTHTHTHIYMEKKKKKISFPINNEYNKERQ